MIIADLKITCSTCNGSGQKPGVMAAGISQINPSHRCPACHGRGFLLTELGQDVWKTLRPFIEELIDSRLSKHRAAKR